MATLSGRKAVVTGAGRGIGRAIARALAQEGAQVVVAARTASEIESAAAEIHAEGGSAWPVVADLTDARQVEQLIGRASERMEGIDILVNNAGIGTFRNFQDLTVDELDCMWAVNVRGVFLASRAALPGMIAQGGGDIITIGSLAGKNAFAGGAGYAATKWALRGMLGSLMLEVRQHHIRTVMIFPGSVDTDFSSGNKRGDHITKPEDIARAVLFALAMPPRTMISEIDVRPTNPR